MAITLNGTPIVPTPLVTVQTENEFKESGKVKKSVLVVTLKGKALSLAKNNNGDVVDLAQDNEFGRLGKINTAYSVIEGLVVHSVNNLFVTGTMSAPFLSGKVKLKSKSYQADPSSVFADYTIVFEKVLFESQDVDENWSLDPADEYDRFVKVTRSRSITLNSSETATYQLAITKLPASSSFTDGASYLPSTTGSAYNKTTNYTVNTEKNSVECTESWTICKTSALVEETYSIKESADSIFKSFSKQISIKGLAGPGGGDKYANANAYLGTITIPEIGDAYDGSTTDKIKSISVSRNVVAGTITVNMDASGGIEKAGEIYRTVDITDNVPTEFYASIAAIGKPTGPILQRFGTKKQGSLSVNITVIYKDGSNGEPSVSEYKPAGNSFVDKDEKTYDERSGKVTRSVTWTYGGDFV
jgi:hypothetical protein